MAKTNSFSNVSNDLILMKSLTPPTITLNELLDISDNQEQDHLNWFRYLFRFISRSNSSTRGFVSTDELENKPCSLHDEAFERFSP